MKAEAKMIKTAQDAYLAGRQAGIEKLSSLGSANASILAANLGLDGGVLPVLGTVAGTGLGTYLGDKNLRSAGISAAGALGGGQIGANLGLAGIHALAAAQGIADTDLEKYKDAEGKIHVEPAGGYTDLTRQYYREKGLKILPRDKYNKLVSFNGMVAPIFFGGNLLGQLAGGGAAGYYTKRGSND
jgi:hypothetical protein